jgi:uncharacterized protein
MRNRLWTAVALVGAALVTSAPAQSPPPADAMVAARELATTMKLTDQLRAMLPTIMWDLKPAIVQGRPEVERDFDALLPTMLQAFETQSAPMLDAILAVYAANFTADELREVSAFYQRPTGQKFLQKMPLMMQQSMATGQAYGRKAADEMRARMIDELRKKGHKI